MYRSIIHHALPSKALWLLAITSLPAVAQERLPASDFLAQVDGRTVSFYNVDTGGLVGVEKFLPDARVVWQPRNRMCVEGEVSVQNEMVCFKFPELGDTEPACWAVLEKNGDMYLVNQDRWRGQTHKLVLENRGQKC